jgi:hypothetical protein
LVNGERRRLGEKIPLSALTLKYARIRLTCRFCTSGTA